MTSFIDNSMTFSCDFDEERNRWWCTDQSSGDTFYVSGLLIPNGLNCYSVIKKIIDEQFPIVYPNYKFYGIKTNINGRVFIRETQSYYPDYLFTILVKYKDKNAPTYLDDDVPLSKISDEELCKPIIFPKKTDKPKDELHKKTDKPKDELHKETDKSKDELHKETDKSKDELHKETDKSKDELHKETDKSKDELHKETDKSKDELHKETDKKDELHKETDKKDEQDDEFQIDDTGFDDSDDYNYILSLIKNPVLFPVGNPVLFPVENPVLSPVKNKYEHCLFFDCDYDAVNKRWWFINPDTDEKYYFSKEYTDTQSDNFDEILCFIKNQLEDKYPFLDFDTPFLSHNGQFYDRETDTYYPPNAYTLTVYYK